MLACSKLSLLVANASVTFGNVSNFDKASSISEAPVVGTWVDEVGATGAAEAEDTGMLDSGKVATGTTLIGIVLPSSEFGFCSSMRTSSTFRSSFTCLASRPSNVSL